MSLPEGVPNFIRKPIEGSPEEGRILEAIKVIESLHNSGCYPTMKDKYLRKLWHTLKNFGALSYPSLLQSVELQDKAALDRAWQELCEACSL
ncbi:hypothetical protein C4544_02905 [candidate division WS5 bacterium]|uniref:Uncharacterized protein n=1 Tax=candidate division WS5 bacterium TaxID=2093353 RepID=A0A419DEH0_9BACT|nr:MAG: hypothetical protein C4544_02905 [candidate division WS5 bacterium]